jgi:predicted PurR-regulated permease PerM
MPVAIHGRSNRKLGGVMAVNQEAPLSLTLPTDEKDFLRGEIQFVTIAQGVVAIAAAIGLIYLLKIVMVTVLVSLLLAFALDPVVTLLSRLHVPRGAGAGIALLLLLAVFGGLTFFFYSRALDFVDELPRYSSTIRDSLRKVEAQAEKIESTTRTMIPDDKGRKAVPVQVQEAPGLTRMITAGAQFSEAALAASFVPFLIYFMLTWKAHAHAATLHMFPKQHRLTAYRTIGRISEMMRAFIVSNLIVGLINAVATSMVFWWAGLPYFYFLGPISAFVGLIPNLGVFFALIAPLAAGMGTISASKLMIVSVAVISLHLITMNVLYPKVIGQRLRLNPLAVALALLFWAWIWGALGLILAVPLLATTKIVCDYVEPLQGLADWLGD